MQLTTTKGLATYKYIVATILVTIITCFLHPYGSGETGCYWFFLQFVNYQNGCAYNMATITSERCLLKEKTEVFVEECILI